MKMESNTPLNDRMRKSGKDMQREARTEDIRQGFRVVSSEPTTAPRNYYESIVIYVSGATYRLYTYDEVNSAWRYATLT